MRNFNITVNGKQYTVGVEELNASSTSAQPQTSIPVATPAPKSAPAPAQTPAGEGEKVTAPMPGTILDIKKNVGDTVKSGESIIILEAMKMENDIVAPCDGKITSITVKKGDAVETNQVIATVG